LGRHSCCGGSRERQDGSLQSDIYCDALHQNKGDVFWGRKKVFDLKSEFLFGKAKETGNTELAGSLTRQAQGELREHYIIEEKLVKHLKEVEYVEMERRKLRDIKDMKRDDIKKDVKR
jgi:hypothetical protein